MKYEYRYKSRFFQSWFLFTFLPLILFTILYYYNLNGAEMVSNGEFWTILAVELLPLTFLLLMKLEVCISANGISYGFFPIHWKRKIIKYEDILELQVVSFDPLRDFLGYGYRVTKRYGIALITNRNTGLYIRTREGKRITIEIGDYELLEQVIGRYAPQFDTKNIVPISKLMNN